LSRVLGTFPIHGLCPPTRMLLMTVLKFNSKLDCAPSSWLFMILNYISRFIRYRAINNLRLGYKNQSGNSV